MQKILFFILFSAFTLFNTSFADEYHASHTAKPTNFSMSVVDDAASGAYGLVGHDITKNGYTDLISFAYTGTTAGSQPGEIFWYEFTGLDKNGNTTWKKHLLAKKKHVVQGAFMDVDHDGYDDLVFMSDFEVPIKNEAREGNIWWAKRPKDLNVKEWETHWIGQVPGAHRIAALDLNGQGEKGIVVIPLFGVGEKPIYGPASITLFVPNPKNPQLPWKKKEFSDYKFHAIHDAIVVNETQHSKQQSLLIAAKEGLVNASFYKDSQGEWQVEFKSLHAKPEDNSADLMTRDKGFEVLGKKKNANWSLSGLTALSSVDKTNTLIASIDYTPTSSYLPDEPWHGDTASIYQATAPGKFYSGGLKRVVLEKRTAGGHAIELIDKGDGCPDVLAGFRAYPTALMIYTCHKEGQDYRYEKQIISERSANAIVLGNWYKDKLAFATAGFGLEGDPYILVWKKI